jgi:Cu(I)/Ag(I) efflux system membrane protein CusA/SilA
VEQVRPKMMTVLAIMAGLLPIMWSPGTGSEIMQSIAVQNSRFVVLGNCSSSR